MEDLLVILVLHQVRLQDSIAFTSITLGLRELKGSLFVYDNSPRPQKCASAQWNIFYVHDPSNPGVSKAYNEGYKKARELNKKWMMLADQDTLFPESFFDKIGDSMVRNSTAELFAPMIKSKMHFISPYQFKWGRGFRSTSVREGMYSMDEFKFINSGLVLSTDLFQRSKGYDERFPLDFSDLAFVERVILHQRKLCILDVICTQNLSADTRHGADALHRFSIYLKASRLFGKNYHSYFFLFLNRILRSIKLSFRFRTVKFVTCLIQTPQ